MDKNQLTTLIRSEIERFADAQQYGVKKVPYHIHNNLDAPALPYTSIANYSQYRFFTRTVVATSDVLTLNSTPYILVPIQTGAVTIVEGITAFLDFKSVAYTGANALEFRYTDASGAKVTADISTTFLNASADAYASVAGVTAELVPVPDAPIVVRVPTANPGAGNSPITFVVHYRVVPFLT